MNEKGTATRKNANPPHLCSQTLVLVKSSELPYYVAKVKMCKIRKRQSQRLS